MVKVTLDTNMLDAESVAGVQAAADACGLQLDLCTVSVNRRERGDARGVSEVAETLVWGESKWGEGVWGDGRTVRELLVLDETPLGSGVLAGAADVTRFEAILKVISNGSFPPAGQREGLTPPQRRQLRDAMSLEAHARSGRDVFITADRRGFINHGRRETLEQICATRIVAADEVGDGWP